MRGKREQKTAPRFLVWRAGEKIALLRPARSLGRNMKTKNRFVALENRKALVRVEAGLQVTGWEVETNRMRSGKCEDGRETDRGGNSESEDFIRKKDNWTCDEIIEKESAVRKKKTTTKTIGMPGKEVSDGARFQRRGL